MQTETIEIPKIETHTLEVRVDDETVGKLSEITEFLTSGSSLTIRTKQENDNASELLIKINGLHSFLELKRKEIKEPVIALEKEIDTFFKVDMKMDKLNAVKETIRLAATKFLVEQRRVQQEAERKAVEDAQRAEAKRREVLAAQMARAEAAGKIEKAEAIQEKIETVYVPVVIPVIQATATKGTSLRGTWKAKVIDFSKVPSSLYLSDPKVKDAIQSIINKMAAASKGGMNVSGVEFYEDFSLSASRG